VRNCGGTQTGSSGTILSPNYPNNYGNNNMCEWVITAPLGTTLFITFNLFSTEYRFDYVWVVVPSTCVGYNGYTGYGPQGNSISVSNNTAAVIFYSDSNVTSSGFNITWRAS
jgi:CUB/sushi domain-containing protein